MGYIHVQIEKSQVAKKPGSACGDAVATFRNVRATYLILADGIGSGIEANIYANMAASRLQRLIEGGQSLRKSFGAVVATMHQARGSDLPYAVFTVVRVLNNGETTVLAYEMPEALFVGRHSATVLKRRNFTREREVISESNLFLEPREGILLYTDGISLAGVGGSTRLGWSSAEVARYVNDCIRSGEKKANLQNSVLRQAKEFWGEDLGDDCTVINLFCRSGREVTLLTGPPLDPADDQAVVKSFMDSRGVKVVCGATTAAIVARELGRKLELNQADTSLVAPPGYSIEGIDLVTEGAVTLNQVYNILDEDSDFFEPESSVTRLHTILMEADKIVFMTGSGKNPGHADIMFRQQGILPRHKIVKLLAAGLAAKGHLTETVLL